jgi:hypothetical protein
MNFIVLGEPVALEFEAVVVAGFTGRDRAEVLKHVEELAAEGVKPPAQVPSFYLVSPDLLTQATGISTLHDETSGEAEIALLVDGERTYVTLASDHTDRRLERHDIALSKQICPKILAREAWPYDAVAGHWDQLRLESWISHGNGRVAYQSGEAGQLLDAEALLAVTPFQRRPGAFVLLAGTLPALGGIRASVRFGARLIDPFAGRAIALEDTTRVMGDVLRRPSQEVTADAAR